MWRWATQVLGPLLNRIADGLFRHPVVSFSDRMKRAEGSRKSIPMSESPLVKRILHRTAGRRTYINGPLRYPVERVNLMASVAKLCRTRSSKSLKGD